MMDLAMNFDTDECLVIAMFDKGNSIDTMEEIDNNIPLGNCELVSQLPKCSVNQSAWMFADNRYL